MKTQHSKVRIINYTALETQGYIKSQLFTDKEVALLFSLRSKCLKECNANFKSQCKETNEMLCILYTTHSMNRVICAFHFGSMQKKIIL